MANLFYSSPRARFFDSNANPLSLGSAEFYFAGTTTPKAIYTDSTETTQASNPQVLDIEGYVVEGGIWLGKGDYKLVLKDQYGATLWTQDNISGDGSSGTGSLTTEYVKDITELRGLTPVANQLVYMAGYHSSTDIGGGYFLYDSTDTTTDDNGYTINTTASPASGRYKRISNESTVNISQFGITPQATGTANSLLTNAQSYVVGNTDKDTLIFDSNFQLSGSITFTGEYDIVINKNCYVTESITGSVLRFENNNILTNESKLAIKTIVLQVFTTVTEDISADVWGTGRDDLASISTDRRIVLNGGYSLSPQYGPNSTLTLDSVYITKGTVIGSTGATAICTINNLECDLDAVNVFTDTGYELLNIKGQVPVRLFQNALTTLQSYKDMLAATTNTATRQGSLLWDVPGAMTVTNAYTGAGTYRFTSTVAKGTTISCGNDSFNMGAITNGDGQIITTGTLSTPACMNGSINLSWFDVGLIDGLTNVNTTHTTFLKAIVMINNSKTVFGKVPVLEGNGKNIYFTDIINITSTNNLVFKNINFILSELLTWVGAVNNTDRYKTLNITTGLTLEHCSVDLRSNPNPNTNFRYMAVSTKSPIKINGGSYKNLITSSAHKLFEIGTNTDATGDPTDFIINNAELIAGNSFYFYDIQNFKMTNCTLKSIYSIWQYIFGVRSGYVTIDNCQFTDDVTVNSTGISLRCRSSITNSTFVNHQVSLLASNIADTGMTLFKGNTIDTYLGVSSQNGYGFSNFIVTDNMFEQGAASNSLAIANIRIVGENGTTVARNVTIKNNSFTFTTSTAIITTSAFANFGHTNCLVVDNACDDVAVYVGTSQLYKAQELGASTDYAEISTAAEADTTTRKGKTAVIFPAATTPLKYVAYLRANTVLPDVPWVGPDRNIGTIATVYKQSNGGQESWIYWDQAGAANTNFDVMLHLEWNLQNTSLVSGWI